jgi:hypothetical protein
MTKPQTIVQQNQTSNAKFSFPLLFDNSIKVIHPKKKKKNTSFKAVQEWVAKLNTQHAIPPA